MIIAAAGNDGPFFGTIYFPGNLIEVLTVGCYEIIENEILISSFSSRGPTIWELKYGMGLIKPDLLMIGKNNEK